jgi:L-amino acid N-acyltransferase YncA
MTDGKVLHGRIRQLAKADVPDVLRIWNAAITEGESTRSATPLTADEVGALIFDVPARFEAYCYETAQAIVAWGGLTRYHEREAYGATAELSIYVSPQDRRRGIGRALARHALMRAQQLGFHAIVVILQAEAVHTMAWALRLGFRNTGRLTGVLPIGSDWRDVFIFHKLLLP